MSARVVAFPGPRGFTVRRGHVTDGGEALFLALAVGPDCHLVALRREPDGRWLQGIARLPHAAVRLPDDALLAVPEYGPALNGTARRLGLVGGTNNILHGRLDALLRRHGRGAAAGPSGRAPAVLSGFAPAPASVLLSCFGYPDGMDLPDLFDASRGSDGPLNVAGASALPGTCMTFDIDASLGDVDAHLAGWREDCRAALARDWPAPLPSIHWDGTACGLLADTGRAGDYRRQAVALYPMFAPALLGEPGLRTLVDAGRPFETELAAFVAGRLTDEDAQGAFNRARLRRLRGLDVSRWMWARWLPQFVGAVARLPVEDLPSDPGGWAAWLEGGAMSVAAFADTSRLDLATLMPDDLAGLDVGHQAMIHIKDVAERCASTLVGPLLGIARDGDPAHRAAMRLLYGLGDYRAALARSRRWHGALAAFEAALPDPDGDVSWPALFEPLMYGDVEVRALTTPAELRAEGAWGADADGNDGLEHCVGGYAPRCYAGTSHILSIRRRTASGWERLSTAEIAVRERPPFGGDELVVIRQHRGRRNAPPCAEAEQVFNALLDDIGHRVVWMDPAARARRDPGPYRDGADWTSPGVAEATLAAWRPHLPRAYARMGVDEVRDALLALYPEALSQDADGRPVRPGPF